MDLNKTFYNCSRATFHTDECDETCGIYELTETDTEFYHEVKRWELAGMSFEGVPTVLRNASLNGVLVDPLGTELKFQVLVKLLIDNGIIERAEFDDAVTAHVLKRMTLIREKAEAARKEQRKLAIVQSRLLGPNGKPLN